LTIHRDWLEVASKAGIKEVVLTGIRLGLYGRDQSPPMTLVNLLERVLECSTIPRIRLSSLEPIEVNDALIGCMSNSSRICPHLHVPLQSGDDEVLELMNRPYRRDQYRESVLKAVVEIPDLTLGCDVIVGFPGETEDDLVQTQDFLYRCASDITMIKSINPLFIMAGSEIDQKPEKYGIVMSKENTDRCWSIPGENDEVIRRRRVFILKNTAKEAGIPFTEEAEALEYTQQKI